MDVAYTDWNAGLATNILLYTIQSQRERTVRSILDVTSTDARDLCEMNRKLG